MKRINVLSLALTAAFIAVWPSFAPAASTGMAINDDGIEVHYTGTTRERRPKWAGQMLYHFSVLTSQETDTRNLLITGTADLHKWRKLWPEKKFMLTPRAELHVLDFFDRKFIVPGAALLAQKRLPDLGPYELRGTLKLAPGLLASGQGKTVWGFTTSLHRPFLENLEVNVGFRYIRASTEERNTLLEKGLFVGIGHFF